MSQQACMTFITLRTRKELATVPLSDSPIPRLGEDVELPDGIGTAASTFNVAQVIYHYRMGFHDRPWYLNVTVLLGEA